ncbi:hypothetical protein ACOSP7_003691 [Xanthoceras sorbifolium]|uniref:PGG domain-containing protein n=1 Tax=Xanthoceras sorbifolium TaxID=99658 RepID=A0ABQ8IHQ3_9ROSI|nr:hypothetical protein JRO89_XS01G0007400 [Xanthoceras sorbifolium]
MANISHVDSNSTSTSSGNCIKKWFFQDSSELGSDYRNNMLVVATLIVAVTFQTGIKPPGGTWQKTHEGDPRHQAGKAILAGLTFPYHVFLVLNTLAFSMSTQLILVLVYHKKLYFEVVVATLSMVATYVTAVWSLSPEKYVKFRYVSLAALFPYLWRLSYQTVKPCRCPCSSS